MLKIALFYFGGFPIFRINKIWATVVGKWFVNAEIKKKNFSFLKFFQKLSCFTSNLTFLVIFGTIDKIWVGLAFRTFAEPS